MKTEDIKVEIDGEEKTFSVRSPSLADQREAQKAYNTAFTDAIKSNSVVRAKMDDVLEEDKKEETKDEEKKSEKDEEESKTKSE